ncbi:MAG: helix-turn-helix domain-containing protein [Lachnospiraceae bacterium]|jgi:putative transcriptional regulator|nr:helix-turn-helix domain-containing protein [Lachnospiraceae bacterium]MBR4174270.1 helix-turn-helix domain-containing protein [Lachnospiraceae bacterium]
MATNYVKTEYVTKDEIKALRSQLGMTQKEFAAYLGCSKPTVERWEKSDMITGPIALLTDLLNRDPDLVLDRKLPDKTAPLRLWYMFNQHVCTVIDADIIKQQVKIYNYTDNLLMRAFGSVEKPTYKEYEEFLESRCFPRQRDKMKLILRDLNLPFYDPLMIIEKTEGRMAEDDFWIRVER